MNNIFDLISIGILLGIIIIMIYKIKELYKNEKKNKYLIDKLEENLSFAKRRLDEDGKILLQKVECAKCFCERKPGVNFKESPIPGFVSIYPYTQRVMDVDCKFCNLDPLTDLCLAKDKKYIKDRLKEEQSYERKIVLGEK